ncbi:MAG: hypothetical protein AAF560_02100 [Acidobacteriota bacterium]
MTAIAHRHTFTRLCGLLLGSALIASTPLSAGVVLKLETVHFDARERLESTHMEVDGQQIKMDLALPGEGGQGEQSTLVFRGGETPEIVVIQHRNETFMVLDPDSVAALGSEMRVAMAEARAQIDALPPEQRAIVRRMLEAQLGSLETRPKPPPTTVFPTSFRKTLNDLPCRRYDVYRQGTLIREVWVSPWNDVTGIRQAFDTLHQMSDFYSDLMRSFDQLAATGFGGGFALDQHPFDDLQHMDGFPVLTRNFIEGALASEITLRSVSAQDLDPTRFAPPEGYRQTALPPR